MNSSSKRLSAESFILYSWQEQVRFWVAVWIISGNLGPETSLIISHRLLLIDSVRLKKYLHGITLQLLTKGMSFLCGELEYSVKLSSPDKSDKSMGNSDLSQLEVLSLFSLIAKTRHICGVLFQINLFNMVRHLIFQLWSLQLKQKKLCSVL